MTASYYDTIEKMDTLINSNNIKELLEIICTDKIYENYFFNNANNIKYYLPLKVNGYFEVSNAPGPQNTEKEGYYIIPHWNVLTYLENISKSKDINDNTITGLIEIITAVSLYHKQNNFVDNPRTWWYFIKILKNLPNANIYLNVIDLLPIWLDSQYDLTLVGSEISKHLLTKFLNAQSTTDDIVKTEKIVDYLTDVKWIKPSYKSDLFPEKEEPVTKVPYFWVNEAFSQKAMINILGANCSKEFIYKLSDKLKYLLWRHYPVHSVSFMQGGKNYIFSTVNQQSENDYGCTLGLEEQANNDTNIKVLHTFDINDCNEETDFINYINDEIVKSEHSALATIIKPKLKDLYDGIHSDASYIWINQISGGGSFTNEKPEDILSYLIRDLISAKAGVEIETTNTILSEYYEGQYKFQIFQRFALYISGKYWTSPFKELFWEFFKTHEDGLLDEPNYEPELHELFKNNVLTFTESEKKDVRVLIEKGPKYKKDDDGKYINYWKQRWYSSLKADPGFKIDYDKYRKLTQTQEEVFFGVRSSFSSGFGSSPLTKEDILKYTNTELSKYFDEFKEGSIVDGKTVAGLSEVLIACVKEQPNKFDTDLDPFINSGYIYIQSILNGLKSAWKENKPIEWPLLFSFIKKYIKRADFWQDKFIVKDHIWHAKHEWVVGAIAEIAKEYSIDESKQINVSHLTELKELIKYMLNTQTIDEYHEIHDPATHVLNSTFGKLLQALIFITYREIKDKKLPETYEIKWTGDIKSTFESCISKNITESFILLGEYLHLYYWFDKNWTELYIKKLLLIDSNSFWSNFMSGYLLSGRVYPNIYTIMKDHYIKAIEHNFEESYCNEKTADHIAIGYLRGYEQLKENNLVNTLFNSQSTDKKINFIGFLWMQRDYLIKTIQNDEQIPRTPENQAFIDKIIEFWRWINDRYKTKELQGSDKKILAETAKLSVFLPEITQEYYDWLENAAKHINYMEGFNASFFIEYLHDLKDTGTDKTAVGIKIGKIYLEILSNTTPTYDQKFIFAIVEHLFILKDSTTIATAKEICNIYGQRGEDFLRPLWERYKTIR